MNLEIDQVLHLDLSYLRNSDRRAYSGHAIYMLSNNRLTDPDELPDSTNKRETLAKVDQFAKQQALAGGWPYRPEMDQKFKVDWAGNQNGSSIKH